MNVCGWFATACIVAVIVASALGNDALADTISVCVLVALVAGVVVAAARLGR